MRRDRVFLLCSLTLCLLALPAAALTSGERACRKAIGLRTLKLAATALQEMQRCSLAALAAGMSPAGCTDPLTADSRGRIAAADALLHEELGGARDRCAGVASPSLLQYSATCPAPCAAIAVGSFATLADCLSCQAKDWAAELVEDEVGAVSPPLADAEQSCLRRISGAGLKYFKKRLTAMVRCQKKVDAGRAGGDCALAVFFDPRGAVIKQEDGAPADLARSCNDGDVQNLDVCDPAASSVFTAATCTIEGHRGWSETAFARIYPFSPSAPLPVCSTPPAITTIAAINTAAFPPSPIRPYAPLGGGTTWYVSTTGSDAASGDAASPFRTINHALDVAQAGDLILVHGGTYYVQDGGDTSAGIVLAKNDLKLANVQNEEVIVRPLDPGVGYGMVITGDRVTVDGLRLQRFASGGITFGRLATPQQDLVLKNLIIEGGTDGIRSAVAPSTPNPTDLIQGLLLENVTIAGSRSTLVGFNCGEGPCRDVMMQNLLVIMGGGGAGNSGSDAVAMENGANVLVLGSRVTGASADGFDFKADDVAIINSIAANITRNGMKLWRGGDIVNSLVYNTGADAALVFDGAGTYRVLNSVIAYHAVGYAAYSMTVAYDHPNDPVDLDIVNSIFFRNSGEIWASGGSGLDVRSSIFFGSENGVELTWARTPAISVGAGAAPITDLESAGGGSANLGFVDPLFTDAGAADWTLQAGSPGRDGGTAALAAFPSYDILCNPRIIGAQPDLGAYENP